MRLKLQPAWSGCWIALVTLDQPDQEGLYLSCKGSMFDVQNQFDTPGFLRKIWVSDFVSLRGRLVAATMPRERIG
jgi:hypothetical protein